MKNIFSRYCLFASMIVLTFSLSSCFDIKEEVTINKDGSGSFIQTFSMGDSPFMQMALAMQNDSTKTASSTENKMDSTLEAMKERLSAVEGISNIQTATAKEDFKYTLMYDFESVEALNRATRAAKEKEAGSVHIAQKQYSFRKGKFTRYNLTNDMMKNEDGNIFDGLGDIMKGNDSAKDMTEEEKEQAQQMIKMFFADASYTYVLRVPNKVKSYTNKSRTTLSEDKKVITMKIPLMDMINEGEKISTESVVKFK